MVDPDYTATVRLDRYQARALVAASRRRHLPQALRAAAVARLLLHNALRVDEACAADIADLGEDCGHQRAVSGASIVAISDIGETTQPERRQPGR